MKKQLLCSILLLASALLMAQKSERQVLALDAPGDQLDVWHSIPLRADPFLAFSVTWESLVKQSLFYRFANDDRTQNWQSLPRDAHGENLVSELQFVAADWTRVQIRSSAPEELRTLKLHFYSPGRSELSAQAVHPSATLSACRCMTPDFRQREDWCPTGNCTPHPNPQATSVTHLIVHHAASTNASSDWAGVVRSIWDFHVNTNGWDDIGYNWLIDPNGVVYEGRGNDIQGAHFCGRNSGTAGFCMLGNFNTTEAQPAAVESLVEMLAWKNCDRDLDPLATTFHNSSARNLPVIAGHRDGCSTECPGNLFYPTFSVLRGAVKAYLDGACQTTALSGAEPELTAIRLAPNPSPRNQHHIQLAFSGAYRGPFRIHLYQATTARVLRSWRLNKNGSHWSGPIELEGLASGLYLLQIQTPTGSQTLKLLRE
ncbi:MAG: N-acetylmuramoyl-L-alanine amidase [Bacteroidota bacterium]